MLKLSLEDKMVFIRIMLCNITNKIVRRANLYVTKFFRKLKFRFNGFWEMHFFFINKQISLHGELYYKILILNRLL